MPKDHVDSDSPKSGNGDLDDGIVGGLELVSTLLENWKTVVLMPVAVGVAAMLIAAICPKIYTGTARILPPQQTQPNLATALSQLGGLASLAGSALNTRNPTELYVGVLKARSIADTLISKFNLQDLYSEETLLDTRKVLANKTELTAGRDGIITISVEDKDPKRAADIANAYVNELQQLLTRISVSDAGLRRIFFEKQLNAQKETLKSAEVALRETQESTGLFKLDDQGRAIIENTARLRAQVAAKEIQLQAMATYATEANPQYVLVQQELLGLRAHLAGMERGQDKKRGDVLMPTGQVPQAGLDYVRKLREVKYHEAIFEFLARQYEAAKVEEARESMPIQVIDRAVPPDKKTKPRLAVWGAIATGLAFLLASTYLLTQHWWTWAVSVPALQPFILRLKRALKIQP